MLIAAIAPAALARTYAQSGAAAGVPAVLVDEGPAKAPDIGAQVRAFGNVARRGTG